MSNNKQIEEKAMGLLKKKWEHLYIFGNPKRPFPTNYENDLNCVMLGLYQSQPTPTKEQVIEIPLKFITDRLNEHKSERKRLIKSGHGDSTQYEDMGIAIYKEILKVGKESLQPTPPTKEQEQDIEQMAEEFFPAGGRTDDGGRDYSCYDKREGFKEGFKANKVNEELKQSHSELLETLKDTIEVIERKTKRAMLPIVSNEFITDKKAAITKAEQLKQ